MEKKLVRVKTYAKAFVRADGTTGVSKQHIYNLIYMGKLKKVVIDGAVFIEVDE